MNSLINDLPRIANGVSLVAKEIVRRSDAIEIGRESGVVESLVKKTVVSVTDLSGLTRGRVQRLESSRDVKNDSDLRCEAEDKVVYFNQDDAGGAAPGGAMGSIKEEVVDESHRVVASLSAGDAASGGAGASEQVSEAPESQSVGATGNADAEVISVASPLKRRKPRERKVPSTPFSRALGFASLGAGLAWGTVQESAKRLVFGRPNVEDEKSTVSPFLSERNAERLALALCRMRGAALKLGQMLSIQDESLVPAPILAALEIVRQGADVMPRSQLNHVLDAELGPDWSSKLSSFNYEPIASASIGQVHEAVTHDGLRVAMKIQYPGVAESIESDIENVKLLLDYTNLIPKGLFLDRAMKDLE